MSVTADREGLREALANEVTPEMLAAAWAVVRDRYPHGRVLGPGPGFREAITAALAARPLCDLEARIVVAETEAEVDREFAEVSRRQADALRADLARLSAEPEALKAGADEALRAAIRAWSARLHIPVTRMMSRALREEFRTALSRAADKAETMEGSDA